MKNTMKKMVNVAVLTATIFTLLGVALTSERYVVSANSGIVYSINYKDEIIEREDNFMYASRAEQDLEHFKELINCIEGYGIYMTDGNTYNYREGRIGIKQVRENVTSVYVKKYSIF